MSREKAIKLLEKLADANKWDKNSGGYWVYSETCPFVIAQQALALLNQPEPSEITTIDNKPLWARNFLTSLMYEPNQAECIQQRIQEVISIINRQAADIIQKEKEIAWEICKVNFRDAQLRDERDGTRELETEIKILKEACAAAYEGLCTKKLIRTSLFAGLRRWRGWK